MQQGVQFFTVSFVFIHEFTSAAKSVGLYREIQQRKKITVGEWLSKTYWTNSFIKVVISVPNEKRERAK